MVVSLPSETCISEVSPGVTSPKIYEVPGIPVETIVVRAVQLAHNGTT